MDPDLKKKWQEAMETAKLSGGGGNGVDTANIMLGRPGEMLINQTHSPHLDVVPGNYFVY